MSASTQNASKDIELEDLVQVFKIIFENPKFLSPDSPTGPTDNYNELIGQLGFKLVVVDFIQMFFANNL